MGRRTFQVPTDRQAASEALNELEGWIGGLLTKIDRGCRASALGTRFEDEMRKTVLRRLGLHERFGDGIPSVSLHFEIENSSFVLRIGEDRGGRRHDSGALVGSFPAEPRASGTALSPCGVRSPRCAAGASRQEAGRVSPARGSRTFRSLFGGAPQWFAVRDCWSARSSAVVSPASGLRRVPASVLSGLMPRRGHEAGADQACRSSRRASHARVRPGTGRQGPPGRALVSGRRRTNRGRGPESAELGAVPAVRTAFGQVEDCFAVLGV